MTNEKAPERIWIDAAPHLIADATRHIYVEPPPSHFRDFNSVEYVRADLLVSASARKEERSAIKSTLEDYFKHFFCTCHGSTRTGGHFVSCPITIRDEVLGRLNGLEATENRKGEG